MDEHRLNSYVTDYADRIMKDIDVLNNKTDDNKDHPMRVMTDLVDISTSDENLAKMPIHWDPWF